VTDELARRSSAPAQALLAEETGPRVRDVLSFELAGEVYALPLASIHEILKMPPVTGVPRAPDDVLGIISVRGRITTVLDLRRRLRLEERPMSAQARVLLVDSGTEFLGLMVDAVRQVYRLSPEEVELSAAVSGELADHVLGIGRPGAQRDQADHGGEASLLILLDPETLLRREP